MSSNLTDDQVWAEFDLMQKWAMAKESIITRDQFFARSRREQHNHYDWMRRQVPDHAIGRYWIWQPLERQRRQFLAGDFMVH